MSKLRQAAAEAPDLSHPYATEEGRAPGNRRRTGRYRPRPRTTLRCHRLLSGDNPDLFLKILDLSAEGVRLLLKGLCQEGDNLVLEVESPHWKKARRLLAYVVWSMPSGDDASCVGGRFLRQLSQTELRMVAEL
jgi:PilZ domain